jgi:crotonobetainyl-CoA:carnitine CoA-transferase CaiB-like acyl-CoA transferase
MTSGPLAGIRVVEVGRYISAPFAGMLLADLGAQVIKVEETSSGGDPMRLWQHGTAPSGSPQFAAYNRGKRSVALDLKSEQDQEVLQALVRTADVLIQNGRPGTPERLGFGYESVAVTNPGLVYVSISGFGPEGDSAHRPAFDTVVSALGGLYSQILNTDVPTPIGPAFSDLLAGIFAALGALSALCSRERDGRGQHVDISMLAATLGFLTEPITSFLETGDSPQPGTRQRRAQAYGFLDRDGRPFVVHLSVPEKFWRGLTEVVGRVDLREDPRFCSREARFDHYGELQAELQGSFSAKRREDWIAALEEHDVPVAPMLEISEVLTEPAAVTLEMALDLPERGVPEKRLRTIRPAIRMSHTPPVLSFGAPTLDEAGDSIRSRPEDAWDWSDDE